MRLKTVLFNEIAMQRALSRISHEIIEKNKATVKKFLSTKEGAHPNLNNCPDITVYWQQKANGKAFHLLNGKYEIIQSNDTIGKYRKGITGHYNVSNIQSRTIVVGSGKDATTVNNNGYAASGYSSSGKYSGGGGSRNNESIY